MYMALTVRENESREKASEARRSSGWADERMRGYGAGEQSLSVFGRVGAKLARSYTDPGPSACSPSEPFGTSSIGRLGPLFDLASQLVSTSSSKTKTD